MSSDLLVLLLLVLVVLLGSALCSGVEAALLTVSPIRVHELAARERPVAGARRLAQLRQRLGRTLSALVIANNGFNIFGSLMLGGYAAWVFEQRNISGVALPVALASAPLLHLLGLALRPLVLLLERILPAITAEAELSTNEEEIRLLARLGSQKGEIEADEAAMIGKVFQLNDLTARDLMTPRVAAPTLDGSLSIEAQRAKLMSTNDPWWVVLGDQVDKVLGVASRERVLTALLENRGLLTPVDLCEPVEYVPEMIRADRLLTGFRRDSGGVRVVVDEFGGFVGVIGAESVLAVLAGWWRKPAA